MNIRLEKYKGQSTRFTCPKCGRKRSFTRYINTQTNEYIDEKVGKCNRLVKCGYHLSPKEFREIKGINNFGNFKRKGSFYGISNFKPAKKELIPIKQIDKKYLKLTLCKKSNFLRFLLGNFPMEDVERVMVDYFIGGTKDQRVVFWQIDSLMRIRTGKIIQYDAKSGKRVKNGYSFEGVYQNPVSWVHSELIKKGLLPDNWTLTQCLFGEHLLIKYPKKPICLVESEKTAVIMSIKFPLFNWMATGGLQNLSAGRILPIKNMPIMAFADLGAFDRWNTQAREINAQIGSKILVNEILEKLSTKAEKEKGLDIADFYI